MDDFNDIPAGNNASTGGNLFDLSDVKANANAQMPALPSGIYNVTVTDVTYGKSKAGALMLTWKFTVINGEFASRTLMDWTILIDKEGKRDIRGLAKLKAYLQILAPNMDMSKFDPEAFATNKEVVNALCSLKVKMAKQNGEDRNNIIDILSYDPDSTMGLGDDLGGSSVGDLDIL